MLFLYLIEQLLSELVYFFRSAYGFELGNQHLTSVISLLGLKSVKKLIP